jgi:hypothetical protein
VPAGWPVHQTVFDKKPSLQAFLTNHTQAAPFVNQKFNVFAPRHHLCENLRPVPLLLLRLCVKNKQA